LINKADIARALDVDPAMVTRWEKRGMPVYDIEAARRWRSANVRPRAKSTPPSDATTTGTQAPTTEASGSEYWQAKTRREVAEAAKAEMEAKKMSGALVERGLVMRAAQDASRLLRDMVLSVPSKSAAELAALASPQEVEAYLREALRRVLEELSRLTRTGLEAMEN
jgi:phage terminase Nu1 subunit (DNA packaging protein)